MKGVTSDILVPLINSTISKKNLDLQSTGMAKESVSAKEDLNRRNNFSVIFQIQIKSR